MTDAAAAVRDVLDRFCRGWEAGDADAVLECFAVDAVTTVVGTDRDEYWRGYDAFAPPFQTMATAFSEARYTWEFEPAVTVSGDVAWADGVIDSELTTDGQRVRVTMRTTWTLRLLGDGWRVVQAHFSVAPDAPVAGY